MWVGCKISATAYMMNFLHFLHFFLLFCMKLLYFISAFNILIKRIVPLKVKLNVMAIIFKAIAKLIMFG